MDRSRELEGRSAPEPRMAPEPMTLPLELEITYEDGSTERVRLPVDMWNLGPRFGYRLKSEKPVRQVVVDPRRALPDVDRRNNEWGSGNAGKRGSQ